MQNKQQFTFSQLSGLWTRIPLIFLVFLSWNFNYFVCTNKLCNKIYMTLSLSPEINKNIWICNIVGKRLSASAKETFWQEETLFSPIINSLSTKETKSVTDHLCTLGSHFDHQPVTESESWSASGSVHGQHIRRTLTLHSGQDPGPIPADRKTGRPVACINVQNSIDWSHHEKDCVLILNHPN